LEINTGDSVTFQWALEPHLVTFFGVNAELPPILPDGNHFPLFVAFGTYANPNQPSSITYDGSTPLFSGLQAGAPGTNFQHCFLESR